MTELAYERRSGRRSATEVFRNGKYPATMSLQASGRSLSEQFAHQQPEIGRTRVHHQPLQNIFPSAQMQSSHPAPVIQVLIPSLQLLAALP